MWAGGGTRRLVPLGTLACTGTLPASPPARRAASRNPCGRDVSVSRWVVGGGSGSESVDARVAYTSPIPSLAKARPVTVGQMEDRGKYGDRHSTRARQDPPPDWCKPRPTATSPRRPRRRSRSRRGCGREAAGGPSRRKPRRGGRHQLNHRGRRASASPVGGTRPRPSSGRLRRGEWRTTVDRPRRTPGRPRVRQAVGRKHPRHAPLRRRWRRGGTSTRRW